MRLDCNYFSVEREKGRRERGEKGGEEIERERERERESHRKDDRSFPCSLSSSLLVVVVFSPRERKPCIIQVTSWPSMHEKLLILSYGTMPDPNTAAEL